MNIAAKQAKLKHRKSGNKKINIFFCSNEEGIRGGFISHDELWAKAFGYDVVISETHDPALPRETGTCNLQIISQRPWHLDAVRKAFEKLGEKFEKTRGYSPWIKCVAQRKNIPMVLRLLAAEVWRRDDERRFAELIFGIKRGELK